MVSNDTESNEIKVEEVEVAGVIRDSYGNTWTIPAENTEEPGDLANNPFAAMKFDERFHYQIEPKSRVDQKRLEGFVPVLREEVGLAPALDLEYGKPTGSYVEYADSVLVKIPKVLAERRQARKLKLAKEVVEQTEPTPEMLARTQDGRKKLKSINDTFASIRSEAQVEVTRKTTIGDEPN